MSEVSENQSIQEFTSPTIHLDVNLGEPDPNNPKVLFSLRIPAEHQADSLSLVRMQDCDLTRVLRKAKDDHRNLSKFKVSTKSGEREVKLQFLVFPNKDGEIQIDYTYTPQVAELRYDFSATNQVTEEVGQCIHTDTSLKQKIADFSLIVFNAVSSFINHIFYDSLAANQAPDFLVMTPPLQ